MRNPRTEAETSRGQPVVRDICASLHGTWNEAAGGTRSDGDAVH